MADLKIKADVHNNQTFSACSMPKNGQLEFINASGSGVLQVTVKGGGATPFCEQNGQTEISPVTVPANDSKKVKICKNFGPDQFAYAAQIGTAAPEDPIVILEPDVVIPPWSFYLAGGLVIGVLIGYVISTSMLARRSRSTA